MMDEKRIRKELELFNNQLANSKMLFERTGDAQFGKMVYDTELIIFSLKFVLGEAKIDDNVVIMDTKDFQG